MAERAETGQRSGPRARDVALFVVAYFVASRLGLLFAPPPAFVSAVWPPAGVTLAAALLLGPRGWIVIWATTLLAGSLGPALSQADPAVAVAVAAATATGSTLRAVLGAYLLRRFGGARPSLRQARTVAALTLGAGVAASLLSATIGVLARSQAGFVGLVDAPRSWLTWWLADAAGVIIVAPVLLLAHQRTPRPRREVGWEAVVLAATLAVISATALTGAAGPEYTRPVFALLLPLVVWPAFRFGSMATSIVVVVIAVIGLWGAALGAGPLAANEAPTQLVLVQVVLIVIATTGLVLAAASEERREAMERLAETTSLLQAVTEGTPDVVFVKDREGRYLSINSAGARYMGRRAEEVVGKTDPELFGPDMLRQIRTYDRLVLETGEVRTDEYTEPKDGVRRTFLATKGPVRNQAGAITGLFGISREITDRKLERRLLNGILEGTHDVVSAVDLDFRFVAFNQALREEYKKGFGVDLREGAKLADVLAEHPEALAQRLSMLGRAFRGEESRATWTLGKEGNDARWFDVLASPLRDETGHVIGGALIGRDVTNAQEAARALRASQSRFHALSVQAPVGIFESDRHGHCTFVNEAWCALAGLSKEEAIGQAWIQSVHPEDLARVVFAWEETAEHGSEFRQEYRFLHANGSVVWVTGAAERVSDPRGLAMGFLGTASDVTARRASEEALRRTSFALAAANRELESFSYSVSHDLRAPLRGIDGFSRALEEDYGTALDSEARGYIQRIRNATKRMGQIIDDLLLLSRVARTEVRRESVDLSAVAREVDAALRAAEPGREVAFEVADGLRAQADGRLVRLLLENLLGNAWKYTSKRARARVSFACREGGGEAAFYVRDDGAGFDMAYAHKLFGAFQRLHSSSEFPGSGIGLATVARIVERHGGQVWAEGEVGKGAMFSFTLGQGGAA